MAYDHNSLEIRKERALDALQARAQAMVGLKAHYGNATLSAAQVLAVLDAETSEMDRLREDFESIRADEANDWRERIQKASR